MAAVIPQRVLSDRGGLASKLCHVRWESMSLPWPEDLVLDASVKECALYLRLPGILKSS